MRLGLAVSILLSILTSCMSSELAAQNVQLSNADAKAAIEAVWNMGTVNLSIGPHTIVGGPAGGNQGHACGSGTLNEGEFAFTKQAQAVGLLSITEEESSQQFRQGQTFSWGQMLDATTAGVSQRVIIQPTAMGAAKDISATLPQGLHLRNCLKFKMGSFQITNVVKNEPTRRGITDYRVVFVTYNANWAPEYRQLIAQGGGTLSTARKAVLLFKYDTFNDKWIVVTNDLADADKEFNTNSVASVLANAH